MLSEGRKFQISILGAPDPLDHLGYWLMSSSEALTSFSTLDDTSIGAPSKAPETETRKLNLQGIAG